VDGLAGAEVVVEAHPALIVWVLPSGQDVLVARVVGPLVHHPGPNLHPDGVAAAQVGVEVGAVAVALIATALVVLVLEEDYLERKREVRAPNQTELFSFAVYHDSWW